MNAVVVKDALAWCNRPVSVVMSHYGGPIAGRSVSKMEFLFLTASTDRDNEFKNRTIV